jgi:hypothetical protein
MLDTPNAGGTKLDLLSETPNHSFERSRHEFGGVPG